MPKLIFRLKGGEGSGNAGHAGIPGHQGGSLPQGTASSNVKKFQPFDADSDEAPSVGDEVQFKLDYEHRGKILGQLSGTGAYIVGIGSEPEENAQYNHQHKQYVLNVYDYDIFMIKRH